jgi:hypothetical protein
MDGGVAARTGVKTTVRRHRVLAPLVKPAWRRSQTAKVWSLPPVSSSARRRVVR